MNRRRFLRLTGATVTGPFLAGCSETSSSTGAVTSTGTSHGTDVESTTSSPTPTPEPRFTTVLDAVSDLGCDPSGTEPSGDAIRDSVADGTLIEFPPGEYLVTEPLLIHEAVRFGIRGLGASHRDVRFVHPQGYSDLLLNLRDGERCVFENFTVDQTSDRKTNSGLIFLQRDGLVVRDIEMGGFTPTGDAGTKDLIAQVTDANGMGVVERYVNMGGGEVGVYPAAHSGFYSGRQHHGTLKLVDCHLEECGSNGVYASKTFGPVQISGGLFKNNDVSQIRVSGEGTFVRNAKIVIDTDNAERVQGTYNTVRGLWWESGWQQKTGGIVEDCQFVVESSELYRGLVEVDGTAGSMTIRDCDFEVNRDGFWAFVVMPPGKSAMGGKPERPWDLTVENLRITGDAADGVDVHIDGRPGTTIDGLTIEHRDGTNRDGLYLSNSHDTSLRNCSISTSRYPFWLYRDESRDGADCLLELGEDVEFSSSLVGRTPLDSESMFGADAVDDGTICIPDPPDAGSSMVVIRTDGPSFYGRAMQGPPEYLWFTRRYE